MWHQVHAAALSVDEMLSILTPGNDGAERQTTSTRNRSAVCHCLRVGFWGTNALCTAGGGTGTAAAEAEAVDEGPA